MLLRASPSVRSRLIRGHAVYTRRQDDDHLISESPGGSVSARGSVGHLGYHPVGHREQRGLWAQAGHRSPSCPIGTPAQPGAHAGGRGRTGAREESLFYVGPIYWWLRELRRFSHSRELATHNKLCSYSRLPPLPPEAYRSP